MALIYDFTAIRRDLDKLGRSPEVKWGPAVRVTWEEFVEERFTRGGSRWVADQGYYERTLDDGRRQRASLPFNLGRFRWVQTEQ